jgi:hypothetical protein
MLRNQAGKTSLVSTLLLILAAVIVGMIIDAVKDANKKAEDLEARCPRRIVQGCTEGNEIERQANAELCAEYKARGCW